MLYFVEHKVLVYVLASFLPVEVLSIAVLLVSVQVTVTDEKNNIKVFAVV